jgi:hypothetical protein
MFSAYDRENARVTIDNRNRREMKRKAVGYSVRELKNGSVIVCQPSEWEASARKRRDVQQREAQKYTKLGTAIPKQTAKDSVASCRALGISQSQILLPIIQDTSNLAQQNRS